MLHGPWQKCIDEAKDPGKKARAAEATMLRIWTAWGHIDDVAEAMDSLPHPKGWKNKSLLDWADWMMANAGTSGRLAVARTIEKLRSAMLPMT